ncbi:hypothetical protein [Ancylobacter radicis]|uniref:Uncharacterized protein n=1 Tax=Ancylobacter radicis TaxID=2836179 RepID=A0ABS5RBM5_9HYPH|nr:hypothetical protein [Ancylobacter radicis]MBS9479059.1 hypothetical protein [Ancylobacter radicis]
MQRPARSGRGWLRAPDFGSATATYELDATHAAGPRAGRLVAELAAMIGASATGWATLVLDSGDSVTIDVQSVSALGMAFTVREPVPPELP